MVPIHIIDKYYLAGSELHKILLAHSFSVADKALEIAQRHPELEIDTHFVYEASLLHDIGIYLTNAPKIYCFGEYPYICHGFLGAEIMRREGLEKHALVCERHTGSGLSKEYIIQEAIPIPQRDMLPESVEEKLVCFADKFFSKSRIEEVKTIDQVRKSLSQYGVDTLQRFEDMVKLFL
ncbi:MAG: HD domain-containing protein [Candidatus Azobacteroides sp.]|nr:HD domain-containing protein [Candidatus Azobacteroides sp.]